MFLAGEATRNADLASRLKIKPHTVGRWRQEEDWDGLRLKIDRRAAELFVEKIASDRVDLNVRHYRIWEVLLGRLIEDLKVHRPVDIREMERIATIVDRAQRGQRLAKGLSVQGETEEAIRAQGEAEVRQLIDTFIDAIKETVPDEETRDQLRQRVLAALPDPENDGAGLAQDEVSE
jgi:hypothetical protein